MVERGRREVKESVGSQLGRARRPGGSNWIMETTTSDVGRPEVGPYLAQNLIIQ